MVTVRVNVLSLAGVVGESTPETQQAVDTILELESHFESNVQGDLLSEVTKASFGAEELSAELLNISRDSRFDMDAFPTLSPTDLLAVDAGSQYSVAGVGGGDAPLRFTQARLNQLQITEGVPSDEAALLSMLNSELRRLASRKQAQGVARSAVDSFVRFLGHLPQGTVNRERMALFVFEGVNFSREQWQEIAAQLRRFHQIPQSLLDEFPSKAVLPVASRSTQPLRSSSTAVTTSVQPASPPLRSVTDVQEASRVVQVTTPRAAFTPLEEWMSRIASGANVFHLELPGDLIDAADLATVPVLPDSFVVPVTLTQVELPDMPTMWCTVLEGAKKSSGACRGSLPSPSPCPATSDTAPYPSTPLCAKRSLWTRQHAAVTGKMSSACSCASLCAGRRH